MSFYAFLLLSTEGQLRYVFTHGTFLVSRREQGKETILYHLADGCLDFFIELGVDKEQTRFFVLRSFSSSVLLEDYVHEVRLPE